jgi:hypothetical protein
MAQIPPRLPQRDNGKPSKKTGWTGIFGKDIGFSRGRKEREKIESDNIIPRAQILIAEAQSFIATTERLTQDAILRDLNDRELQYRMFGRPIYKRDFENNQKGHGVVITQAVIEDSKSPYYQEHFSTEQRAILDNFSYVEELKAHIRYKLRPKVDKGIGGFNYQVEELSKYIGFKTNKHTKIKLVSAINTLLENNLDTPLELDKLYAAQIPLVKAITKQFGENANPLEAFLDTLKTQMGNEYPLKNHTTHDEKSLSALVKKANHDLSILQRIDLSKQNRELCKYRLSYTNTKIENKIAELHKLYNLDNGIIDARTKMHNERAIVYQMVKDWANNATENEDLKKSSVQRFLNAYSGGHVDLSIDPGLANVHTIGDEKATQTVARRSEAIRRFTQEADRINASTKTEKEVRLKEQDNERAKKFIGGAVAVGAVALGTVRIKSEINSHQPYKNLVVPFTRLPVDIEDRINALSNTNNYVPPILLHEYSNPFESPNITVYAHSTEYSGKSWHADLVASLMQNNYAVASGNKNPSADRADVLIHPDPVDNILTNLHLRANPRPKAVESMLTSTTNFHVFNTSTVTDAFRTGTSRLDKERDFMLRITCPVAIPSGNLAISGDPIKSTENSDVKQLGSQHNGELSHYPRYGIQISEAFGKKNTNTPEGHHYSAIGSVSHPGCFVVFPQVFAGVGTEFEGIKSYVDDGKKAGDIDVSGTIAGTSFSSPGFAGNVAAIKEKYPQLSWDNIMYAVALGCDKNFAKTENITFTPIKDGGLTYSNIVGFGMPNPKTIELIAQNMLYQRTKLPVENKPQVILQDAMNSGTTSTKHTIIIPKNKDIFKLVLDIVPDSNAKDATVTLTDDQGNKTDITLVNGAISRHTDYGHMGQHGGTLTLTSNVAFKLGYVAHVNERGAISCGVKDIKNLKPTNELLAIPGLKEKINALPVAMPKTPEILTPQQEQDQGMTGYLKRRKLTSEQTSGRSS